MSGWWGRGLLGGAVLGLVLTVAGPAVAAPGPGAGPGVQVQVASVGLDGRPAGGVSNGAGTSADGQLVAYVSYSGRQVPGVSGPCGQAYARDLRRGRTLLVSATSDGTPGNGCNVGGVAVSGDGRYVAFNSDAPNLAPGGADALTFLYVKDLHTGRLEAIRAPFGRGRYANQRVQPAPVAMSRDGRVVAVTGSFSTPQAVHFTAFDYDRATGRWRALCDPTRDTCSARSMTPDARFIGLLIRPTPLSRIRTSRAAVFDRASGRLRMAPHDPAGYWYGADEVSLSGDGRLLAVTWTNFTPWTWLRAFVAVYRTSDFALVDTIRRDGLGHSSGLSADGRYLVVTANRTGLVDDYEEPWEAMRFDRVTRRFELASPGRHGRPGNGESIAAGITPDGRTVTFWSDASNLVPGDRPPGILGHTDIFTATFPAR